MVDEDPVKDDKVLEAEPLEVFTTVIEESSGVTDTGGDGGPTSGGGGAGATDPGTPPDPGQPAPDQAAADKAAADQAAADKAAADKAAADQAAADKAAADQAAADQAAADQAAADAAKALAEQILASRADFRVIDPSGNTIGFATFNPLTGNFDTNIVETTVIEEQSDPVLLGPTGSIQRFINQVITGSGGGGGAVRPTAAMMPPFGGNSNMHKDIFEFRKTTANRQTTKCIGMGMTFDLNGVRTTIRYRLKFRANQFRRDPITGSRTRVTQAEIQATTFLAWDIVTSGVWEALSLGLMNPDQLTVERAIASGIQAFFDVNNTGENARVEICPPPGGPGS